MWPVGARCVVCEKHRADMVLVRIVEAGSGPGHGLYACPEPCAQQCAAAASAPEWLRDELRERGLWPANGAG